MEGGIWNYHFAMNGNSYQVVLKHFYSLLTKVSSEETKHLLALPVLLSDGCVLAGERVFSVGSCNVVTTYFDTSRQPPRMLHV